MIKHIFRACPVAGLSFVLAQVAWGQNGPPQSRIEGVWQVNVAVNNCTTGALIRAVHAMNMFLADGKMTETAGNFLRSNSLGSWSYLGDQKFSATFRFFRYDQNGNVASIAVVEQVDVLSRDGNSFTSNGTVTDYNVDTGAFITQGCAVETATRLAP
jgi:hypothetical protein